MQIFYPEHWYIYQNTVKKPCKILPFSIHVRINEFCASIEHKDPAARIPANHDVGGGVRLDDAADGAEGLSGERGQRDALVREGGQLTRLRHHAHEEEVVAARVPLGLEGGEPAAGLRAVRHALVRLDRLLGL